MQDITPQLESLVRTYVIPLGWKLLGAIAVWIIGGIVVEAFALHSGGFSARGKWTRRSPTISIRAPTSS